MATIARPRTVLYVKNCGIGHIDAAGSINSPEYAQNTNKFLIQLQDSTRTDVELISENNPMDITITGEMDQI